jgi:hypothetical protein
LEFKVIKELILMLLLLELLRVKMEWQLIGEPSLVAICFDLLMTLWRGCLCVLGNL